MSKLFRQFAFALMLVGVVYLCGAQIAPKRTQHSSVCGVLGSPHRYDVGYVSLRASVLADGMHGIILVDPECPNDGLPLTYPVPNADRSVADFEKVVTRSGTPGTAGRKIVGEFTGRLRRTNKPNRLSYSLLSVKDLSVENEH